MESEDKAFIRSWPLLLISAVLLIGGGAVYVSGKGDPLAAVAAIAAGLVCLGAWLGTEVVAWHQKLHNRQEDV
jgi:hypothetical protein